MREWSHRRVVIGTIVLTVVSLLLVFGATLRLVPEGTLPEGPPWVFEAIPHINAVLAVIALGAMTRGYLAIRRRQIRTHRASMIIALMAFGTFLALYLYNVSITGPAAFPGPDVIRNFVYLPLLIVHISLAVICLPLLYYVALLALTRPVGAVPGTNHPRVARPALALWAISFALGLAVYLQLHHIYG